MSKITNRNPNTNTNLNVMLAYLEEEVEQAESPEQIADVLKVIKTMLTETHPINTVMGLPNIRAEVMLNTPDQNCNVATKVPESLITTFYDLSDKMNQLQMEDPETFENASKALSWLANNDKCLN